MPEDIHSHELITADRVDGTPIYNTAGERIGHVKDLSIHKVSGQVVYALISFGGFLGLGEEIHPLPWSVLKYDTGKGGYIVPMSKEELKNAPSLTAEQLEELGAGDAWRTRIYDYYGAYGVTPYI